jgi:hypothetical protein
MMRQGRFSGAYRLSPGPVAWRDDEIRDRIDMRTGRRDPSARHSAGRGPPSPNRVSQRTVGDVWHCEGLGC